MNELSVLIPRILATAAIIFRNNSITANLVNRGYDAEFRKVGDTINVPTFSSPTVQDVVAGRGNENTASNVVATNTPVTLNQWKEVKIAFTDLDLKKIDEGRPSEALEKAVIALVDHVDSFVLNQMILSSYSTAGTVGSAFSDPVKLVDGWVKMGDKNVPKRDRFAMVRPLVAGAFLKDDNLSDSSKFGTDEALKDAMIGKLYGFDIGETNNINNFVGGTLSNGTSKTALVASNTAAGLKTITFDSPTLTGTLLKGDIFTIAGDAQEYVVTTTTATASGNSITVSFEPALAIAADDGDAVTFVANHTVAGIEFQKEGYIFGSAPVKIDFTGGNLVESFTDPLSGITFTYEVERVNKSTEHSLSILYGGNVLKSEALVRLLS